jgi:hypothetical protein
MSGDGLTEPRKMSESSRETAIADLQSGVLLGLPHCGVKDGAALATAIYFHCGGRYNRLRRAVGRCGVWLCGEG